jgi:hypothetical protein
MARFSNRARIQAAALLEQEAEYRVTAQLLHVVAIAQRHDGVKEGAPFIAAKAGVLIEVDF